MVGLRLQSGRPIFGTVRRARAIAAILVTALVCELALAVPAFAVARILAARCCDADCPAMPSAADVARCCAIGGAPASDHALASTTPVGSVQVAPIALAIVVEPSTESAHRIAQRSSSARAAPLFLIQRSLQL
jgi:hypothetical protein